MADCEPLRSHKRCSMKCSWATRLLGDQSWTWHGSMCHSLFVWINWRINFKVVYCSDKSRTDRCGCDRDDSINSYSWSIADDSSGKPFCRIDGEMWIPRPAMLTTRSATEQELTKISLTFLIYRGRWGVGSGWSICMWLSKFKIWLVTIDVRSI